MTNDQTTITEEEEVVSLIVPVVVVAVVAVAALAVPIIIDTTIWTTQVVAEAVNSTITADEEGPLEKAVEEGGEARGHQGKAVEGEEDGEGAISREVRHPKRT